MPVPTTTDQLIDHLRKSGLVTPARLEDLLGWESDPEAAPQRVLDRLIQEELLTRFQAERLAAGKYKGFILGSYVILDRIGGGGMGQVYLAQHSAMRRHVAIKVLTAEGAPETVARERFIREAQAAAVLNHPNIIRVFDLRQERHVLYLVMEYVEGLSLQQLITRSGPLPTTAVAHYALQVARGLQHAHENSLVHRDIKPANILLAKDGTIKVLDLGLVRTEEEANSKSSSDTNKTILGTADYLAPEQAMDSSAVDIRADIYSLGATMYCLLAGHPMFPEGRTAQKLMWQQLREPTPIQELRKDVPPKLAAILHKALAKNPGARQQTPWELEQELAEFALGSSPAPEPHLLPSPPPRWNGGISHNGTNFQQVSMNASCAVIELPEYRPEFLKTTLSDLEQSTQTRVLPTTRTPLIQPFAIRSSTSLYEQPLAPGTFQMQLRTAAMAGLSLFIAGLATGLGIFWLIRG